MDTLTKLNIFNQMSLRIIKEQELVIGPMAWNEAKKVIGLTVDQQHSSISFSGDSKDVINRLIAQYERLFGKASHEVCRDAVQDMIKELKPEEIPSSLK
ncbi:MAG: hypothetical protein WCW54_00190 [Candidatus Paceibacterota bacterium]